MAHIDDNLYRIETFDPMFGWGLEVGPIADRQTAVQTYHRTRLLYPRGIVQLVYQRPVEHGYVRDVVAVEGR